TGIDHEAQQRAGVEARAADEEVVGRVLAALVDAPRLAQPLPVGLETARGQHATARLDALVADTGGDETTVPKFEPVHWRVVTDAHTQAFGASVVGIDERLAAAHEEGVGARGMQSARQRRLE